MRDQPDFTDRFENALSQAGYNGADLEEVARRPCASDQYDGCEYRFYGQWVPVRPIISVARELDDFAIENISMVDEEQTFLEVFLADLRGKHQDPAFV